MAVGARKTLRGEIRVNVTISPEELTEQTDEMSRSLAREAIGRWFTVSQERLMEAAGTRSEEDATRDSRGPLQGRRFNNLHHIAQAAEPPHWDSDRQAYVFRYKHVGAPFMEFGTEPHVIRPRDPDGVLAFKWPDAPPKVRKQYENADGSWDGWVYFKKVNHPGSPAIGFTRRGRDAAAEFLRTSGARVEFTDSFFDGVGE